MLAPLKVLLLGMPSTPIEIQGEELAARFAKEACKPFELKQLHRFLSQRRAEAQRLDLYNALAAKLQSFYSNEIQLSGDDPKYLTESSDPDDAELGSILHCQSTEKTKLGHPKLSLRSIYA